jgi:1-acyl-sn-glycerol-3-phosphate acyltransferase
VRAVGKPYRRRYRLERFGRGGYVRLCLRTQTPLVACAIVGAEDANPILHSMDYLARVLGVPHLPITPTFPLLGPLGLLPAPAKLTLRFAEPIRFDDYGPTAADDEVLVGRLSDRVRGSVQSMLDDILSKRHSVFFG